MLIMQQGNMLNMKEKSRERSGRAQQHSRHKNTNTNKHIQIQIQQIDRSSLCWIGRLLRKVCSTHPHRQNTPINFHDATRKVTVNLRGGGFKCPPKQPIHNNNSMTKSTTDVLVLFIEFDRQELFTSGTFSGKYSRQNKKQTL